MDRAARPLTMSGSRRVCPGSPKKHVRHVEVVASPDEIACYEPKEHAVERTLKRILKWQQKAARSPAEVRRKRRWLFRLGKQFLAQAHPARSALVHPVVPCNGREVMRLFSPSRKDIVPAASKKSKRSCACCVCAPSHQPSHKRSCAVLRIAPEPPPTLRGR